MKIDLSIRSKNLLSLTIIVFGMAVACVKQDIQPIPQTTVKVRDLERVMKAIEWLNNELPPNTKSTTEWMPLWESAFTEESNSSQTVEVPLSFLKEYMFVLPECNAKYIQTKDPKYIQNITRMIVETNPKTGETRGYFMSVAPSLKYLEKTNFKFDKSSYLNRDSQLDGYIIFKDIQGNLVNGWVYSDGKITSSLKPANSNAPATKVDEWELSCPAVYCVGYYSVNFPSIAPIINIPYQPAPSNLCLIIVNGCQSSVGDSQGGGGGERRRREEEVLNNKLKMHRAKITLLSTHLCL